jgi:hypothetical protein
MTTPTPSPADVELIAAQVRRRCDFTGFSFTTTADLTPSDGLIGQQRAADALAFGLAIAERGFNVYAAGPPGTGKATAVRAFLESAARARPTPSDWCYVHNFRDPSRPRALRLSPGQARLLRRGLQGLVQAARREIPRAFESEEYMPGARRSWPRSTGAGRKAWPTSPPAPSGRASSCSRPPWDSPSCP